MMSVLSSALPTVGTVEECSEVVEADPRAGEKAQIGRVVLEGDDVAEQRQIAKDDEEDEPWQDEGVHPAFAADLRPDRRLEPQREPARLSGPLICRLAPSLPSESCHIPRSSVHTRAAFSPGPSVDPEEFLAQVGQLGGLRSLFLDPPAGRQETTCCGWVLFRQQSMRAWRVSSVICADGFMLMYWHSRGLPEVLCPLPCNSSDVQTSRSPAASLGRVIE